MIAVVPLLGCASAKPTALQRTIRVDGVGQALAVPDAFVLSAGVTHMDKDMDAVRHKTFEVAARILEAVKPFNLDQALSSTDEFNLHARENYSSNSFLGYELSRSFKFYLTDVKRGDELTEAVMRAGATSAEGRFRSSHADKLAPLARVRGVQDARRKAEGMAAALGMRVGRPISIRPANENSRMSYFSYDPNAVVEDGDEASVVDVGSKLEFVPPQTIKVRAIVRVEFELLEADEPDRAKVPTP